MQGVQRKVIVKEDVKVNGTKGVCQKEFDKEITEIKEELSKLMELLERSDGDPCFGWKLVKRKVQWNDLQQKQRHRSLAWLKNEEFKEAEFKLELIIGE
jgi:hypothetical protein